jgi:hypothetical protein
VISVRFGIAHLALLFLLFLLFGCGGGGSGGETAPTTTPVRYRISWEARSKAIDAPSSALSATLTLTGANPGGGDFVSAVNRREAPAAYTEEYVSTVPARVGTFPMTVAFHADANGSGRVVRLAKSTVTIAADGSGIGSLSVSNAVHAVTVAPGQILTIGQSLQLTYSATDAQGNAVAVTPGSETWSLVDGAAVISLSPDGIATALAPGRATVRVTLDGVVSANTSVIVADPAAFENPGFELPAYTPGQWKQGADVIGSSWTGDHAHGIANGHGAWGTAAHSGAQYAYLQASPYQSSMGSKEQTVRNLTVGNTYRVRFWIARRNGTHGGNAGAPISLFADGVLIAGPVSPPGDGSWMEVNSSTFTAARADYHFRFKVSAAGNISDAATLLDDVQLVAVP